MKPFKTLAGDSVLVADGASHLFQRRMVQPAFHRKVISTYATVMSECTAQLAEQWMGQTEVDITQSMVDLTLKIVGKTMFGVDLDAKHNQKLSQALTSINQWFQRATLVYIGTILDNLPLPSTQRFKKALKYFEMTIYKMMYDRRLATNTDTNDLLTLLIMAQDDENKRLTDEQLRDEIITFILAGHETTAVVLNWFWYLLSQHPEVETKLHAELDQVLGGRTPTVEDLPNLKYSEMVFLETLRLYPSIYLFFRENTVAHKFGEYEILPRSLIFMSPYVMHRNPEYYIDPETFNPERWTPEFKAQLPKFAYLPFGGGSRQCIGESFATMEAMIIIAIIAQKWQLSIAHQEAAAETLPKITLKSKGHLRAVLTERVTTTNNGVGDEERLVNLA
jgi:cytochrome P450